MAFLVDELLYLSILDNTLHPFFHFIVIFELTSYCTVFDIYIYVVIPFKAFFFDDITNGVLKWKF